MPRYYFNVLNSNPSLDDLGEDLPDKEAAWRQATITAGEIFKAIDGSLRPGQEWTLEVTDEARRPADIIHIEAKQMTPPRLAALESQGSPAHVAGRHAPGLTTRFTHRNGLFRLGAILGRIERHAETRRVEIGGFRTLAGAWRVSAITSCVAT